MSWLIHSFLLSQMKELLVRRSVLEGIRDSGGKNKEQAGDACEDQQQQQSEIGPIAKQTDAQVKPAQEKPVVTPPRPADTNKRNEKDEKIEKTSEEDRPVKRQKVRRMCS